MVLARFEFSTILSFSLRSLRGLQGRSFDLSSLIAVYGQNDAVDQPLLVEVFRRLSRLSCSFRGCASALHFLRGRCNSQAASSGCHHELTANTTLSSLLDCSGCGLLSTDPVGSPKNGANKETQRLQNMELLRNTSDDQTLSLSRQLSSLMLTICCSYLAVVQR